jgi:demethylmenaquinone methyltransferase/2-methoxy-6-polyprenyl-1,4-benzoquinol methylase
MMPVLNFMHMDKSAKDPANIQTMFSTIAPRYDVLNRILSLGIDSYWRRFAVGQIPKVENARVLDVATGTCDVAMEIVKRFPPDAKVIGVDFSEGMLSQGREKVKKAGCQDRIDIRFADVTSLPFEDNTFDASIIAFGIRNVRDYKKGISEMGRVVKRGGKVIILEFTSIQNRFFRTPYRFYITKVLPFIGELVSGKKGAYKYLPSSMLEFPASDEFKTAIEETGLKDVRYYKLTFGIAAVHVGTK